MDDHSLACLDFARIRELLAGYAYCGLGRRLAEGIRPTTRVALVRRWLDQIEELRRLSEERGLPPFGGISDIREILQRCGPPLRVGVEEVAQIGATLDGTHAVAEYLRELPDEFPEFQHLAGRVGDFRPIADRIRRVIDERGQVRDDASPKLRSLREEIESATHDIRRTIERLLRNADVRRLLQYPNHTFHGDRLVLPLRAECRGRLQGIIHRTSDSGATIYVEPSEVVEINNRISNLRSEETEEIGRLLWDLVHEVHLNVDEIRRTLDTLAVIDLVCAKLRFAKDYGLRCPALSAEGTLGVRTARHPLLIELARERAAEGRPMDVVPIDYRIGDDFNLLIITGPNTGGKTVTLKTIGLLSLMFQAGVPVPVAAGSEMGVFSNILIDVGDEQSMQQSLSTFSGHLTRILDMLRHAGSRALLLIDELGAGTDPDEGAALGQAILDELLSQNCRGVVTTHLGALKGFALTRQGAENACVEFDAETLRPTYHLSIGEPGVSNAIDVAHRLGMSKRMIAAARKNVSGKHRALTAALKGTRTAKREAEQARKEAETARLEADRAQKSLMAAQSALEQQQSDFQQWVQRVVHLQPGDAVRVREFDRDGKVVRMRLDQHRAEVDVGSFSVEVPLGDILPPQTPAPPPKPPRPTVVAPSPKPRKRKHVPATPPAQQPSKPKPPESRSASKPAPRPKGRPLTEAQAAALQPSDTVFVQRFHREGRVVRLNPSKRLVVVNMGLLEVEVPYDGLAMSPKRQPAAKPRSHPKKSAPQSNEAHDKPGNANAARPPHGGDKPN